MLGASIRNYGDIFGRFISKILLTPFGPPSAEVQINSSSNL